jgi:DNA-binding MurR/RpiR family transcriptional regulator
MKISVQHTQGPESAFASSRLGRRLLQGIEGSSHSNRAIADHLLRNPVRAAASSIEDLAGAIGVSTATLSRFARSAGFKGFPDLRAAMAEAVQSLLQPVEKLRELVEREPGPSSPLGEGLAATIGNVRAAAEGLDLSVVDAVVARLVESRGIYVMGFGLSAHVAGLLTLGLQPFCPQLVNVVEFGGTEVAAGRLMNVDERDLLIAISFPRYAADAVHLATYARDRGARIVAITDSPASPLARVAHHLLLAPSAHPVLSSSQAAAVLVAEALVTAMMVSRKENVAQAAKLTEAISAYLYRSDMDKRPPAGRKPKT